VQEALARKRAWEERGPSQWGYGVAIDLLALERRVSALERLSGAGQSAGEDNDSPGEGWRWVNAGVRVQEGDEFLSADGKTWHPSTWRGEAPPRTYRRRRIKSHANHDAAPAAKAKADQIMQDQRAEIERLRDAIRRLEEQDATLSVCDGNVTVTMDGTFTDEDLEAISAAACICEDAGRADIAVIINTALERLG
jgi:hypothetical protein